MTNISGDTPTATQQQQIQKKHPKTKREVDSRRNMYIYVCIYVEMSVATTTIALYCCVIPTGGERFLLIKKHFSTCAFLHVHFFPANCHTGKSQLLNGKLRESFVCRRPRKWITRQRTTPKWVLPFLLCTGHSRRRIFLAHFLWRRKEEIFTAKKAKIFNSHKSTAKQYLSGENTYFPLFIRILLGKICREGLVRHAFLSVFYKLKNIVERW